MEVVVAVRRDIAILVGAGGEATGGSVRVVSHVACVARVVVRGIALGSASVGIVVEVSGVFVYGSRAGCVAGSDGIRDGPASVPRSGSPFRSRGSPRPLASGHPGAQRHISDLIPGSFSA